MIARLALEDGTIFTGTAFGATGTQVGEVVFNTAMTGYQEIFTDPSYCGQIVTMTFPLIGNYGVNPEDVESARPHLSGFVVKELPRRPSNFRSTMSLPEFLVEHGVIGIAGIDTRALTRRLRIHGTLRGVLSTEISNELDLIALANGAELMTGSDLASRVMPAEPHDWREGRNGRGDRFAVRGGEVQGVAEQDSRIASGNECDAPGGAAVVADAHRTSIADASPASATGAASMLNAASALGVADRITAKPASPRFRIVAIDCGIKRNILRCLVDIGGEVSVVPGSAGTEAILALRPDGIMVGNGPGDPAAVTGTIETLRGLIGRVPIFGVCLGHQMLALAAGAKSYKLKFGHHGANHPVLNRATGRVEITSQNHGFAIDADSLAAADLAPTHVSLNDGSLEGFAHTREPLFAVQYHPEAAPGPHDSAYLFDCFREMIETRRPITEASFSQPVAPV